MYKNEGNEYFREKDYGKAVIAYSEGLKKGCEDVELNAMLHTNRGAAQFHLGEETGQRVQSDLSWVKMSLLVAVGLD